MKKLNLNKLHSVCTPGRKRVRKPRQSALQELDRHTLEDIGVSLKGDSMYSDSPDAWKTAVIASRFSAGWGLWSQPGG